MKPEKSICIVIKYSINIEIFFEKLSKRIRNKNKISNNATPTYVLPN